jgi:hypothetical protein
MASENVLSLNTYHLKNIYIFRRERGRTFGTNTTNAKTSEPDVTI